MDDLLLQLLKDEREIQLMISLRSADQQTKNTIIAYTCPCLIRKIIGNCYMYSDAELAAQKNDISRNIEALLFKVDINQAS